MNFFFLVKEVLGEVCWCGGGGGSGGGGICIFILNGRDLLLGQQL